MAFNHYAKIKTILEQASPGWYIRLIDQPTKAKMFDGTVKVYDHYYRIYDINNKQVKYCKFQQLKRLAMVLHIPVEDLPVINVTHE